MITGRQIREARALMRWTVPSLSVRSRIPEHIIGCAESVPGKPNMTRDQFEALRRTFEQAGVEFLNHRQPGVRLRKGLVE